MKRKISTIMVTGGGGFIGSHFIKTLFSKKRFRVINIDNLSLEISKENLNQFRENDSYKFFSISISDPTVEQIIDKYNVDCIVNFAAESHVDNSIANPEKFIETNIFGTFNLLRAITNLKNKGKHIHFHNVSTDEVFGSAGAIEKFVENSRYNPSSPYSASKASSDLLVKSWGKTFGLCFTISYCSNNYGPNQHLEKFLPKTICSLIHGKKIPVYGNGKNIRNWIHVNDHCNAVFKIISDSVSGESYNIASNDELSNLEIINHVYDILRKDSSLNLSQNLKEYIQFVPDRLGHDAKYSVNTKKISTNINWTPQVNFLDGLEETIEWYKIKYL